MTLFFQTFACVGLTFILKYGKIFDWVRDLLRSTPYVGGFFDALMACSMCLGFWVGIVLGDFFTTCPFEIVCWGFYSSAICWLMDYVTMAFDKYLEAKKPECPYDVKFETRPKSKDD